MNKYITHGDMVRLTGWSEEYEMTSNLPPSQLFEKEGYLFPVDSAVFEYDKDFHVLNGWNLENFNYEIIEHPAFTTVDRATFNWQCKKWNLKPKTGIQPGTQQATLFAPDGTPAVFFICHADAVNEKLGILVTTIKQEEI